MKYHLSIPKMGESVQEATIQKWLVTEGDTIQKDQIYIEVSTDKVESEIPSPFKCKILKITQPAGNTVLINSPIAEVEVLEEFTPPKEQMEIAQTSISNNQKNSEPKKSVPQPRIPPQPSNLSLTYKFSPLVKKLLLENDVAANELPNIPASGADGRTTKQDVLNYLANRDYFNQKRHFLASPTPQTYDLPAPQLSLGDEFIAFDRMRSLIAQHMTDSKRTSAHCTSICEIDLTELVNWRDTNKDNYFQKFNQKITYTHLLMHLAIKALEKFPKLNAHNRPDGYILKKDINLGFATALPNGNLIVPCLKKAQTMSVHQIVEEVSRIGRAAKEGKLSADDTLGGTFTVSNTGIFGSMMGTPIINQPQVGIMALGEIHKTPAVVSTPAGDQIAIRTKLFASLSYDHRIIDGAYAASYLNEFRQLIQNFTAPEI